MANKGVGLDLLNAGHCNGYAVRPSFLAGGFSGSVPHVMELKHIVALAIFICAGFGSVLMNLLSQRVRDISLFCMVFMAVLGGLMDVNFFGQLWYRGTSRGVEIMPIDIAAFGLLVGSVVLPRYAGPRIYWPASFGILLLYFAYCGGSVLTTTPQHYGSWELWKIFRGVIIFLAAAMFIRTRRELQILVLALGCAVCFEGLWCVQQKVLRGVGRVPGTLFHENSLSMYLCTVSPVLLAAALSDWPRWMRSFCAISCAVAAVTVVMTLSRAGIPAFGLTMFGTAFFCVTWRITRRKIVAGLGFTIGATLLLAVAWEPLTQRFGAVSLKEELMEADAVETRGTYWRIGFAIADEQPYGVGLNNWSYAVSKKYGPKLGYLYNDYDEITWDASKEKDPDINFAPPGHSLAVITWGELGGAGLFIFALLWLRWFQVGSSFLIGRLNTDPMHRVGIGLLFGTGGIFLQSLTEWTYRQTPIMMTFQAMMGALAALYYAKSQRRKFPENEVESEWESAGADLPLSTARMR